MFLMETLRVLDRRLPVVFRVLAGSKEAGSYCRSVLPVFAAISKPKLNRVCFELAQGLKPCFPREILKNSVKPSTGAAYLCLRKVHCGRWAEHRYLRFKAGFFALFQDHAGKFFFLSHSSLRDQFPFTQAFLASKIGHRKGSWVSTQTHWVFCQPWFQNLRGLLLMGATYRSIASKHAVVAPCRQCRFHPVPSSSSCSG